MIGDLSDKVALVTGSASGLGKRMAEVFAEHGAKVVIADLNLDKAKQVAQAIEKESGTKALALKMDVTDESEVNKGVDEIVKTFGQIDILISNAGIQTISPIVDFEFEKWKQLLDVHINGAFLTAKACMKKMIEKKNPGRIIIIGSIHSVEASSDKAAYVTAKHSLVGLVKSIAKEGAKHKICANLIAPGFVKTPLVEKQIPEQAESLGISEEEVVNEVMLGETVDKEFTTVDDIAETALFFAGFKSTALTGQSLLVTHGWHMQ